MVPISKSLTCPVITYLQVSPNQQPATSHPIMVDLFLLRLGKVADCLLLWSSPNSEATFIHINYTRDTQNLKCPFVAVTEEEKEAYPPTWFVSGVSGMKSGDYRASLKSWVVYGKHSGSKKSTREQAKAIAESKRFHWGPEYLSVRIQRRLRKSMKIKPELPHCFCRYSVSICETAFWESWKC